ncbi:MAG: hypothetical protein HN742_38385 [Lentisphaerae bacterium]|nr:hypothetical protein [Lentisphaerota bacterium]MBT4815803.1 hypothetical protein [Lentisphaerota bacterium]MBT5609293.1 hypothetical protein [Lentisphaerota bacterium]MBT7059413.1 hypothetical protein [Lentisphaerota bacterium]MBT7847797.1 hypothetical protein [Lentisphaerota bacterium]
MVEESERVTRSGSEGIAALGRLSPAQFRLRTDSWCNVGEAGNAHVTAGGLTGGWGCGARVRNEGCLGITQFFASERQERDLNGS